MSRRRYWQDPATGELHEIQRRPPSAPVAPAILGDIKPYRSVIDGSIISSRSQHRQHLARHNCQEIGNEAPGWLAERHYEARHGRQSWDPPPPPPGVEIPPEAQHVDALEGLDVG